MSLDTKGLIIGAGPAGLATAYVLKDDAVILEKEEEVGGLCRSPQHDGGVFDIGGHSFHTPHPEVRELITDLAPGGLFLQKRQARVYSHGTIIPYPFQRYYDQLPDPRVVEECEQGLAEIADAEFPAPDNFEQYIVQKFGRGIADHFMLPYNRKLWARDISKISCEWTSERVAAPKGASETFDLRGGERKPLQPDTRVGYPQEGGFAQLFDNFVPHVSPIRTGTEVVAIDPDGRTAETSDGSVFHWDFLVSTMPIPILVRTVRGAPQEIIDLADTLEYMSLRVELLLVGRSLDTEIQRIYCADPAVPPHKIAMNHNSSDSLRARDRHAIMAEVSLSPDKPLDVDTIAPLTIQLLTDVGVLDGPEDVIWTSHIDVKYAYPVYTHERPGTLARIREWLDQYDIHTVGRFGGWEYINSDKCVQKGLDLGRQLKERYCSVAAPAGS